MALPPLPKFVGARVRRREDPGLITGKGKYVADIHAVDALSAAFLRSPYAHARVRSVDTAQAETCDGVVAVLTGTDLNPEVLCSLSIATAAPSGEYERLQDPDRQLLQSQRVRFTGDPVAVIVAETAAAAEDAVEQIMVDYDPLPVAASIDRALAPEAPRLHPEGNEAYCWTSEGGDVDRAFAEADVVTDLEIQIQRVIPNAMEPRAVLASYDPETKSLTVWSTTQVPHGLRDELAQVIGVPAERIRAIAPEVGGGFGAKCNVYPEEVLVPLLARRLGRPVRWVASRSEDYLATVQGRDQTNKIRLAATSEGRVLGAELLVTADCGAYLGRVTPVVGPLTGLMMTGIYDIPNARSRAVGVFTNKPPMEPYRGAGRPEACYMIERGMDNLARKLGLDPIELRKRNFIAPDRFPHTTALGLTYDSGDYARPLEEALRLVDYDGLRVEQSKRLQEGAHPVGIGVSGYVEICGFGPWESGSVEVAPDGSVVVLTGTSPHGQGHETSWTQIVAEILQIPMDRIEVKHGDTAIVREGIGTFGSRSAPVGGTAVLQSSEIVQEGARQIAAHLLEAAVADIRLEEGEFQVVGSPGHGVGWEEVAAAAYSESLPEDLQGKLHSEGRFEPEGQTYPFGFHFCVVEIDPETGSIQILRYVSVDDCGRVINPMLVEGQVHGGIVQGIGQALFEEAHYDEHGNLLTGTLMDYAVPKAHQLPSFQTSRTVTPTHLNPLGAKGIGEAATIGSTPAVVNAVVDALAYLGVDHLDTPLTPEKIWQAMQSSVQ